MRGYTDRLGLWVCLAALAVANACSSDDVANEQSVGPGAPNGSEGSPPLVTSPGGEATPGGNAGDDGANGLPQLPDEEEASIPQNLPAAGVRYVYAANPQANSVVVIDSQTLGIQAVEAGDRPTFVQALADRDAAVALNVRSNDATVVRTQDGVSRTSTLPVVRGANSIAIAPDGRHAVVYYDAARPGSAAAGNFQDVSVLFLEEGQERSVPMTVGFRPSSVHFSADGERAFVVTEDGISAVEFSAVAERGSHIARTVVLATAGEPLVIDVSITPDGRYALARLTGTGVVRWVDLKRADAEPQTLDLAQLFRQQNDDDDEAEGDAGASPDAGEELTEAGLVERDAGPTVDDVDAGDGGASGRDGGLDAAASDPTTDTEVPAQTSAAPHTTSMPDVMITPPMQPPGTAPSLDEITDLDISPDGSLAIAVVRGRQSALVLPLPQALGDLSAVTRVDVTGEWIGSVGIAADGKRALLYTTAIDDYERVTVLDVPEAKARTIRLPKSVLAVRVAPDGKTALLVHRKLPGDPNEPGIDTETLIDRSHGYSVLDLDTGFSKLEPTSSTIALTTSVPDGSYMFLAFDDRENGVREVHRVELHSFLVQEIPLASPPISLGTVPGTSQAFVGQEHADGRITFIDWQNAQTQSVTGFVLNSRIRE